LLAVFLNPFADNFDTGQTVRREKYKVRREKDKVQLEA
jgi:hypothetical protein